MASSTAITGVVSSIDVGNVGGMFVQKYSLSPWIDPDGEIVTEPVVVRWQRGESGTRGFPTPSPQHAAKFLCRWGKNGAWDMLAHELEPIQPGELSLLSAFVNTCTEPVSIDGVPTAVPDSEQRQPLKLGAAGIAQPIYGKRSGEVRSFHFTGDFATEPVPVAWLDNHSMRFELESYYLDEGLIALEGVRESINGFLGAPLDLSETVATRVFQDYQQCMIDTDYGEPLPFTAPDSASEVWTLPEFRIRRRVRVREFHDFRGTALICLGLSPGWEEEHGLDLFFDGAKLVGQGRSGDLYDIY